MFAKFTNCKMLTEFGSGYLGFVINESASTKGALYVETGLGCARHTPRLPAKGALMRKAPAPPQGSNSAKGGSYVESPPDNARFHKRPHLRNLKRPDARPRAGLCTPQGVPPPPPGGQGSPPPSHHRLPPLAEMLATYPN